MHKLLKSFLILCVIIASIFIYNHFSALYNIKREYDDLYQKLQSTSLMGYDLIAPHKLLSYPMGHGMMASAASRMFMATKDLKYLNQALESANWLVSHSDIDKDGIVGWGLPIKIKTSWGYYPKNHEFQITTMFAVLGLLDTYDALYSFKGEKKIKYLERSFNAIDIIFRLKCFTQKNNNNTISVWYSCKKEDATYDASNINAMMAGVISRLSTYQFKNTDCNTADAIVNHLMEKKIDKRDSLLWFYRMDNIYAHYVQDLVHTAYTAYGLLQYNKICHNIKHNINAENILNAFNLYQKNDSFNRFIKNDTCARVWGVAFNLFVLSEFSSRDHSNPSNLNKIYTQLKQYKKSNGHYKFTCTDEREFIRAEAAVLLSISSYYNFLSCQRRKF